VSSLVWTDPETGEPCEEDITRLRFRIEYSDQPLMDVDLVHLVLSQRAAGRPSLHTILQTTDGLRICLRESE